MILGAQPSILWIWFYWNLFNGFSVSFFILFPFSFIFGVLILILFSAIISKFFLSIVNFIHPPKEGIFKRDGKDKDYCYWSLRSVIKKWPFWLARQLSISYIEIFLLRLFGAKIGKNCSLHEGWIDTEFVELGDNVKLGQGSLILSSLIVHDKLILKKTIIKKNAIISMHSVVLPGTKIEFNTVLDALSSTNIEQYLDQNSIYRGSPCRKVMKKKDIKNKSELRNLIFDKKEEDRYNKEILREEAKELAVPFHLYISSGWFIIGFSFVLPGFLFYVYIFGLLEPFLLSSFITINSLLNFTTSIILLTLPLIFIGLYLLHLFLVALFTRIFYKFADRRGPEQGVFDRNLDKESKILDYYHFRSFLFKYPIYVFIRSPFPWLINWELRFLGSNKIGKNSVIEECFLHSHINLGKNCYLGTYTHITNHLVDGVYGEENLTFFEINLGKDSVFEALTGALPGTEVGQDSTFIPIGSTVKFDELKGYATYSKFPASKLDKDEIKDRLGEELKNE
ncbi:MAG: hypothetical protein EU543_01900 [Promethearchaeota archaeon]|nr:MAG: hypothetical protein EU543_01900 [Candidatus Lokiarchaeota archaeon]